MIWESCYWKETLIKLCSKIEKWECNRKLDETDFVEIEQALMIGFYSIRKLIEAKKLSDKVVNAEFSGESYKNIKNVTNLNWHKIEELYDLNNYTKIKLKLPFVCNQIIHSYIFVIDELDIGGFSGIYMCSDYKRNKELYHVSSAELKNIFSLIGNDYPYTGRRVFNQNTKDYDITQA